MNMVRIRHILEMRRACKAPPLLPPKKSSTDVTSLNEKRPGVKEIVDIHIRIRGLRTELVTSPTVTCVIYESEGGRRGPWKMSTVSDVLENKPDNELPSVFSVEFQFERPQAFKVDICDWNGLEASPLGYTTFLISEVINSRGGMLQQRMISEKTGESIAAVEISCSAQPHAQPLALQFEGKNFSKKLLPDSASVFFQVFRIEDNYDRSLIYKSETIRPNEKIRWRQFTLAGSDVNDIPKRQLEVVCYYRDEKVKRGVVGQFHTGHQQLKSGGNSYFLTNDSYKNGRKTCGTFELLKCNDLTIFSFLDYISFGTNLHLAFAVDFSQSESSTNENPKHTFLDDVELSIRAMGECFRDYNCTGSYPAFGFGARIPPLYRESHEFCLNLETDPNCPGVEGVVDTFRNTFAQVQPLESAHFAHVIYYVSKIAQNALIRGDPSRPQYYVLVIITRGKIDDIKETVQAAIFASRAPISIIFLGVGDGDLSEIERLGNAGKKLAYQGRKADRDLMQFVNVAQCREEDPEGSCFSLCERGLTQIPWQLATFMMRNGVVPLRNAGDRNGACDPEMRLQLRSLRSESLSTIDFEDEELTQAPDGDDTDEAFSSRPSSQLNFRSVQSTESPFNHRQRALSTDLRSMSVQSGSPQPSLRKFYRE